MRRVLVMAVLLLIAGGSLAGFGGGGEPGGGNDDDTRYPETLTSRQDKTRTRNWTIGGLRVGEFCLHSSAMTRCTKEGPNGPYTNQQVTSILDISSSHFCIREFSITLAGTNSYGVGTDAAIVRAMWNCTGPSFSGIPSVSMSESLSNRHTPRW